MMKKTIFTILWTIAFFFGASFILGFGSGIFFSVMAGTGQEILADGCLVRTIGISWDIGPRIMGLMGMLLGIFGKLPGTKLKQEKKPNIRVDTYFRKSNTTS